MKIFKIIIKIFIGIFVALLLLIVILNIRLIIVERNSIAIAQDYMIKMVGKKFFKENYQFINALWINPNDYFPSPQRNIYTFGQAYQVTNKNFEMSRLTGKDVYSNGYSIPSTQRKLYIFWPSYQVTYKNIGLSSLMGEDVYSIVVINEGKIYYSKAVYNCIDNKSLCEYNIGKNRVLQIATEKGFDITADEFDFHFLFDNYNFSWLIGNVKQCSDETRNYYSQYILVDVSSGQSSEIFMIQERLCNIRQEPLSL